MVIRFKTIALASYGLLSTATFGAVTPLMGTGYNADVIADNTSTTALVTPGGIDGTFAYYQAGFTGMSQHSGANPNGLGGLPVNLATPYTFTSMANSDVQFALQGALGANALIVPGGGGTGTFTLSQPTEVSSLSFLVTGLNGDQPDTYTLNYSDGSTGSGTFTANDNFDGPNVAIYAMGRVQLSNNDLSLNPTNPSIYDVDVTDGINPGLFLSSITVTDNNSNGPGGSGGLVQTAVFGVSGTVIGVPEPTSLGLLGLAGVSLLRRRRLAR